MRRRKGGERGKERRRRCQAAEAEWEEEMGNGSFKQ
jgi:hypothetical protein